MRLSSISVWVLAAASLAARVSAAPLQVGSSLVPFSATDQNDAPHTVDAGVRLVVLSADMAAGGIVKEALSEGGANLLAAASAVYVADISRMPGLVTKLFALPSMRKRGYPILLDRDGMLTKDWPRREGKVTLIELRAGAVSAIREVSSSAELRQALQAPSAPSP